MSKVWFITGASRGIGAEVARAAIDAGDRVVATSRRSADIWQTLGQSDNLLATDLDVTKPEQVRKAVKTALEAYGRIDVLVNNAGYSLLGALEECSPEEIEAQYATNLFGLISVTKAVLPVLRTQGAGHIFNISSSMGVVSAPGAALYSSTKFAIEGLSEGLAAELAPLGISLTIVEPGGFRTEFLTDNSVAFSQETIDAYSKTAAGDVRRLSKAMDGAQGGDAKKLAKAIVEISSDLSPPLRFAAGEDAVQAVEAMLASRKDSLDSFRQKSLAMAFEEPE